MKNKERKIKQRDMATRALIISGKGGAHVKDSSKKKRKDAKKAIKKIVTEYKDIKVI
jgi:hypothetical protein